MIISHRHRFIFVKTAKTAGSSTELFLRQFCGPDDVVPYLGPDDERIARQIGAGRPRNHGIRRLRPWEVRPRHIEDALARREWPKHRAYRNHLTASDIRTLVGDEVWTRYRTVTIVRDPWEATVSRYYWRAKSRSIDPVGSLDKSVERAAKNWSIYSIDDQVGVDTVLRFERLEDDLARLVEELGVTPRFGLPGAKTGIRPPRTPAHEVLSITQARRVAELARREIETFGYEWSGPDPL